MPLTRTPLMSATHRFCVKCGQPTPADAAFCPICGTQIPLPVGVAPNATHVDSAATMAPGSPDAVYTIDPTSVMTSAGAKRKLGESQFLAGDQIGPRYTVIKLLGAGGMGAVDHAFDRELGVGVAVKLIRPSLQADATAARDLEQRFKRELLLARQITHKHVVRIHDIGDIEGMKYLTMPFIDGETLADLLRREGKLHVARAAGIVAQVAAGLEAAHAKGVVHRDLKPENIMIEKDTGDALIMDFGIARSVESGGTQTAAGSVIGTLEYMPPEQAQGKKVDGRADIYALGLILYDCLVGRQRLANAENPMKEMMSRLSAAPAPPRSLNVEVPEALDRIVRKCLEPAAENRFHTTHELVTALGALTADDYSYAEVSQQPAQPGDPASGFDPDATYMGGPAKASGSDLEVTFAGVPRAAGRPEGDDAATMGPTPAASGGTHKGIIEVGRQFGSRYHIIRELGVGGMGAVYQAWDAELGVAVAVKVIRPEIAANPDASADIERRFKRELLLARQITHPNVVRIHDLGDINGIKYITMPFIEGSDLSSILDEHKQLPVRRALHIARGVVAGLVSAHSAGVVHRDLKPANIMIGVDDVPTIMDFGIARSADSPQQASVTPSGVRPNDLSRTAGLSASTTQAGAVVGTVAYMAPEQASGKPVDQRADIYALGLILYDMVIGGRRREHAQSAVAELMERMQTAPPAPRTIDATIPEAVDAIIRRCVEPDAANRFQTTVELNAAFERLDEDGKPIPIVRRLTRRTMAAAAGLVVLLLGGTYYGTRQLTAPPVEHAPVSVLIADFQNTTNDPTFDHTVGQALRRGLESASFITAFDRTRVQPAFGVRAPELFDEVAARQLAIKQGLNVVLAGSIASRGSGYDITVQATEPMTGNVITAVTRRAANRDQVLPAVTRVVTGLRNALGDETSESAQQLAMKTISTTSLDVASQYAAAVNAQSRGNAEQALASFAKAVELDPKFGLGYQGLAVMSRNMGRLQDAEKYAGEALQYLDNMTERERYATRGYYANRTGDFQQCVTEYGDLIARYPADVPAHNQRAACLARLRDMRAAIDEMKQVVAILPNQPVYRSNLAALLISSGEFKAAEENIRAIKEPQARMLGVLALSQQGQGLVREAAETYQQITTMDAWGASFGRAGVADLAAYEGRFAEAVKLYEQGAAADLAAKKPDAAALKLAALASVHLATGQNKAAAAAAEKALAHSKPAPIRFLTARVFAEAGDVKRAKAMADAFSSQLAAEQQAYGKIIEGNLALKAGDARLAVTLLTEANKAHDTWLGHFDLGRAYLAAKAYPQADSEFDRCIQRRGEALTVIDEDPTYALFPPVYYYLGRVREELKTASFADMYREYLKIRGDSTEDPLLPDIRKRIGG